MENEPNVAHASTRFGKYFTNAGFWVPVTQRCANQSAPRYAVLGISKDAKKPWLSVNFLTPSVQMLTCSDFLDCYQKWGGEGGEGEKSMSHFQTEANTYHFGLRHHTLKRKEKEDI